MTFQKLVLPAAIKDQMDIIGAAETGSGKTLAFGIPIIHGILADKHEEAKYVPPESADSQVEDSGQEADDDAGQGDDSLESDLDDGVKPAEEYISDNDQNELDTENVNNSGGLGCVKVIDDVSFYFMEECNQISIKHPSKKLRALIVTPTRELAIQVRCR